MKIYPSAFIQDLVIKEKLTKYNVNVISIKMGSSIKMRDLKENKKADLRKYQRFIVKLIYHLCSIRPDITFVIEQFSKHNTNLRKGYLQAIKRIVEYLKENIKMRFIFG